MTREEARKAAEVMLAYANGEEIETLAFGEYINCKSPDFNWIDRNGVENYRVKPKPTYRPFKTQEECLLEMNNHPNFGWIIHDKKYHNICGVISNGITILPECGPCCFDFKSCIEEVTFTDGKPFGIKEN